MGAPNFMKMLVQEIKQYNDEYLLFVKNGRRYAPQWEPCDLKRKLQATYSNQGTVDRQAHQKERLKAWCASVWEILGVSYERASSEWLQRQQVQLLAS